MKIRFHPEAEYELDEALAYYFDIHPALSTSLLEEVILGERAIAVSPRAWKQLNRDVRVYWMRRFPYGLVYHATDSEVVIYAFAHMRRKPGYWTNRLS